jgi:hypothetical protein
MNVPGSQQDDADWTGSSDQLLSRLGTPRRVTPRGPATRQDGETFELDRMRMRVTFGG